VPEVWFRLLGMLVDGVDVVFLGGLGLGLGLMGFGFGFDGIWVWVWV